MSARGFGGPVRSPKFENAGGGGGGVLTLDNGLTLTGTNGQLGGPLVTGTNIDLAGQTFEILNAAQDFGLAINEAFGLIELRGGAFGVGMGIDNSSGVSRMGDIFSQANRTAFVIDDTAQSARIQTNVAGDTLLLLDAANSLYQFGDVNGIGNQSFIEIDDSSGTMNYFSSGGRYLNLDQFSDIFQIGDIDSLDSGTAIIIDNGNENVTIQTTAGRMLLLDELNGTYNIGDIDAVGNGTILNITDAAEYIEFVSGGNLYFFLNAAGLIFGMGDITPIGNGTQLEIDDGVLEITMRTTAGLMLSLDQANGTYAIGDITATGNETQLQIADTTGIIRLGKLSAADGYLEINTLLQTSQLIFTGVSYIIIDTGNDLYTFGPANGGNECNITINDTAETIAFSNITNDVGILINGVAGFTGTVAAPATITVNNGIVTNVA